MIPKNQRTKEKTLVDKSGATRLSSSNHSKRLDDAVLLNLQLPIHQNCCRMEVQNLPILCCLDLGHANPALEGLGHPAIGMKIEGGIGKGAKGIDGIDTEFLGRSKPTKWGKRSWK